MAASYRHTFGKKPLLGDRVGGSIEEDVKQHFFRLQARCRIEMAYPEKP